MQPDRKRAGYTRHPFSERKRAVELYHQGLLSKQIAALLDLDDSMVRSWLRKYRAYGLESLRPYSRKQPRKTEPVRASLRMRNESKYREAYEAYVKTLEPVTSIVRRFGLSYGSFRYNLFRYHPELAERRASMKREKT